MDTPTTVMNACAQWLQQSLEEALAVCAIRVMRVCFSSTYATGAVSRSTIYYEAAHSALKHPTQVVLTLDTQADLWPLAWQH